MECYKVLSSKDRKKYGLDLCTDASTPLPPTCWKTITNIPGLVRKIYPAEVLLFCKKVNSHAQFDCVYKGLKKERMPLTKAITACQDIHKEEEIEGEEVYVTDQVVDDTAIELCVGRISGTSEWSVGEADTLCNQAGSTIQAAVILQCAVDVLKLKMMTTSETAHVCRSAGLVEEPTYSYMEKNDASNSRVPPTGSSPHRGRVASCVHKAFKEITTTSSARTNPAVELVIAACHSVRTASTGTCIASFSNRKLQDTITPEALLSLCTSRNGLSKLKCLKMQQNSRPTKSQGPITLAEVLTCISIASQVQTLRIARFESSMTNDTQEIIAGHFFSMTFEMIDQVSICYDVCDEIMFDIIFRTILNQL